MPEALAVDWDEIKAAAIAGVPFKTLAEQWGMVDIDGRANTTALRKRSSREQWPIPRAIMDRAQMNLAKAKAQLADALSQRGVTGPKVSQPEVTVTPKSTNPIDLAADSLIQNGQRSNLVASQLSLTMLEKAAETPEQLQPLGNIGDVKTALSVARIAAGMDREGTQVNIGLGSWGAVAVQTEGESGFREVGPIGENEE